MMVDSVLEDMEGNSAVESIAEEQNR